MSKFDKKIFTLLGLFIILCSACTDDYNSKKISFNQDKTLTEVTINLNTPSGYPIKTKGLSNEEESKINDVYVFGFKTGILSYVKTIDDIDSSNDKMIKVMLKSSTDASDTYKLMIIANAEDWLYPLLGPQLDGLNGKSYNEIQQLLKRTNISEKLYASGGFITMWGELPYQELNSNNNQFTISLLRTVARIDVGTGATNYDPVTMLANWGGLDNFTLEEVFIYKSNNALHFIPEQENYNSSSQKVTKPSHTGNKLENPLSYSVTGGKSLVRDIYLPEAEIRISDNPKSGDENHLQRTAIVVKGSYSGNTSTYYRLDFIDTQGKMTNILRNHLYQFNIKSVRGNGYKTPDEAYLSFSTNMDLEVIEWSDGEMEEVTLDGQYMLGVSKGTFDFPMNEQTISGIENKLTIITNHPNGWKIEKIVDENDDATSWIQTDQNTGNANVKTTISILANSNLTAGNRTAYIHIKAGRLFYIVKVNQTTTPEINLVITDHTGKEITELIFPSHLGENVEEQTFNVSWSPNFMDLNVFTLPVSGSALLKLTSGYEITPGNYNDPLGTKSYTVKPTNLSPIDITLENPFGEKKLRIDFTVDNQISHLTKTLYLIQKVYNAIPKEYPNFAMDGTSQYFEIIANTSWKIEVTDDPLNIIQNIPIDRGGYYEDKRVEKVYFSTNNYTENTSIKTGKVKFRLSSLNSNKPFNSYEFEVDFYSGKLLPTSNSYIMPASVDADRSYLIPVSRANEAIFGSIGSIDQLQASLVWCDRHEHVTTNKTIVIPVGRGNSGYLYVYPGNPEGNDLVAVKVNNKIKWSWHLWITKYDPDVDDSPVYLNGFKMMGRNLGAFNGTPYDLFSLGMYYQWGRKDPFPQSAFRTVSSGSIPIYNASGNEVNLSTSTSTNFIDIIEDPLKYLTGVWLGSNDLKEYSWGKNNIKSVYDPCPPGWRIPPSSIWSVLTTQNFTWDAGNRGRRHDSSNMWLPASGSRSDNKGELINVGLGALYWSNDTLALTFGVLSLNTQKGSNKLTEAGVIRCVKE